MMKKYVILIAFAFSLLGFSSATVGGEYLVSDIYCDLNKEICRYAYQEFGGRGGTEIVDLNLQTLEENRFTQGIEFEDGIFYGSQEELEDILSIGEKLQELDISSMNITPSISLKSFNKITDTYSIEEVEPYIYEEASLEYLMSGYISSYNRDYSLSIAQNNYKESLLKTCRLDDINFRGFGLPEKDFLIIIVSSSNGDCFEGGYITEYIYPISKLDFKLDANLFLITQSKIQNFNKSNGLGPAMNQTSGGIFIELSDKTLEEWISQNNVENISNQENLIIQERERGSFRQKLLGLIENIITFFKSLL